MAMSKDIGFRDYCDAIYSELSDMKARALCMIRNVEEMDETERKHVTSHIPHLRELANFIDWKLQILTKVCPFDWSGFEGDVERTVSVRVPEETAEKDVVAGGYLGG